VIGDEAERRYFLCDVPVACVVDEFSFPEPDERASSMPDNMLPAGTTEVLRAKTNEGGYKLTTHCHKLLTIDITITVEILIYLFQFCDYHRCPVCFLSSRSRHRDCLIGGLTLAPTSVG